MSLRDSTIIRKALNGLGPVIGIMKQYLKQRAVMKQKYIFLPVARPHRIKEWWVLRGR